MKKILILVLSLIVVGAVYAQCPYPECSPYLSESSRGISFTSSMTSKALGSYCHYSPLNLDTDQCFISRSAEDRWDFYDEECSDAGCLKYCDYCNSTGGQCDSTQYGDFSSACNVDDSCDCSMMEGFASEESEVPEVNAIVLLLIGLVVVIGIFVLKKK